MLGAMAYAMGNRNWYRVAKITNSGGAEISIQATATDAISSANANDGDIYYFKAWCDGTETVIDIGYSKSTDSGTFNVYLNDVSQQTGVDQYSASGNGSTVVTIKDTLPLHGWNTIKMVVNGKNASSTDYVLRFFGIRLR
jgi:hypothetical protein